MPKVSIPLLRPQRTVLLSSEPNDFGISPRTQPEFSSLWKALQDWGVLLHRGQWVCMCLLRFIRKSQGPLDNPTITGQETFEGIIGQNWKTLQGSANNPVRGESPRVPGKAEGKEASQILAGDGVRYKGNFHDDQKFAPKHFRINWKIRGRWNRVFHEGHRKQRGLLRRQSYGEGGGGVFEVQGTDRTGDSGLLDVFAEAACPGKESRFLLRKTPRFVHSIQGVGELANHFKFGLQSHFTMLCS